MPRTNTDVCTGALPGQRKAGTLVIPTVEFYHLLLLLLGWPHPRPTSCVSVVRHGGALKMQDRKMTDKDIAGGGKCRTGI